MKGLELSERFYLEHGAPMLREQFPHLAEWIAVGLVGSGSECFGFDDEISRDHDFEPGFCIFLPDEEIVDRKTAFALERAYAKLPKVFEGIERSPLNPVGGSRHGVIRISDFLTEKVGTADGALELRDWFSVPEQSLAEATNGTLFFDGLGLMTKVRAALSYLPEDVRLKKLAGKLLLMGQAGQYNYHRCISRGETAAAQLAMIEFVQAALHTVFLLNRGYLPYYKWSFCALRALPKLSSLSSSLEWLISSGNTASEAVKKSELIEQISTEIIKELTAQGLSSFKGLELEGHAYDVNSKITDNEVRNLHILYGV